MANLKPYALKSSPAIRRVNGELGTNVLELWSVSIIRVDVVSDHESPMYVSVYQCYVLSYWSTTRWKGRVKFCGHPSISRPITKSLNLLSLFVEYILFSV
jgi:hypothetical protein